MKKFLVAILALAIASTWAVVVMADGGPHGGYTATTDGCAGCHRTHTASGPNLLISTSTYDLCMSCHGSAGTGADTNVEDGFFLSTRSGATDGEANTLDNAALLGGGFGNYQLAAVTSAHEPDAGTTSAWGNGVARGASAVLSGGETLSCASCHDPHGSPNYRIIPEVVNGVGVAVAQVDEGAANKDYDTEQWGAGTSAFCAACHGAYHVTRAGSGTDNTNDGAGNLDYGGDISTFSHRVDMAYNYGGNLNPETVGFGGYTLPLAGSGVGDEVGCMTCHLPHGSSAQMTGIADGGPTGTGTLPGDTTATDSALLRLDNRGVCQVCHQK